MVILLFRFCFVLVVFICIGACCYGWFTLLHQYVETQFLKLLSTLIFLDNVQIVIWDLIQRYLQMFDWSLVIVEDSSSTFSFFSSYLLMLSNVSKSLCKRYLLYTEVCLCFSFQNWAFNTALNGWAFVIVIVLPLWPLLPILNCLFFNINRLLYQFYLSRLAWMATQLLFLSVQWFGHTFLPHPSFHTTSPPEWLSATIHREIFRYFSQHSLKQWLSSMIRQTKWPLLKSSALLVLHQKLKSFDEKSFLFSKLCSKLLHWVWNESVGTTLKADVSVSVQIQSCVDDLKSVIMHQEYEALLHEDNLLKLCFLVAVSEKTLLKKSVHRLNFELSELSESILNATVFVVLEELWKFCGWPLLFQCSKWTLLLLASVFWFTRTLPHLLVRQTRFKSVPNSFLLLMSLGTACFRLAVLWIWPNQGFLWIFCLFLTFGSFLLFENSFVWTFWLNIPKWLLQPTTTSASIPILSPFTLFIFILKLAEWLWAFHGLVQSVLLAFFGHLAFASFSNPPPPHPPLFPLSRFLQTVLQQTLSLLTQTSFLFQLFFHLSLHHYPFYFFPLIFLFYSILFLVVSWILDDCSFPAQPTVNWTKPPILVSNYSSTVSTPCALSSPSTLSAPCALSTPFASSALFASSVPCDPSSLSSPCAPSAPSALFASSVPSTLSTSAEVLTPSAPSAASSSQTFSNAEDPLVFDDKDLILLPKPQTLFAQVTTFFSGFVLPSNFQPTAMSYSTDSEEEWCEMKEF